MTEGVLLFPALDPNGPLELVLEGSCDNWNITIMPFIFDVYGNYKSQPQNTQTNTPQTVQNVDDIVKDIRTKYQYINDNLDSFKKLVKNDCTLWFVESLWSQTLVIHMIRTPKIPFIQSRASLPVLLLTTISITIGTILPYTAFDGALGMSAMPLSYFPWLIGMILCYMLLATFLKTMFRKRYGELL